MWVDLERKAQGKKDFQLPLQVYASRWQNRRSDEITKREQREGQKMAKDETRRHSHTQEGEKEAEPEEKQSLR